MSATEQDTKAARKSSSLLHLKSLFHELKVGRNLHLLCYTHLAVSRSTIKKMLIR